MTTNRLSIWRMAASGSVICVGDGRGFVVNGAAAHCLPELPTGFGIGNAAERTYAALLGRLGEKPTVSTECMFIDPVADLAVLGSPDNQTFAQQADDYEALVDEAKTLVVNATITDPFAPQDAWMLSLGGDWFACSVAHSGGAWWPTDCAQDIEAGMSGSPILDGAGLAIGVVTSSAYVDGKQQQMGSPNPRLCWQLPVGLLTDMVAWPADD